MHERGNVIFVEPHTHKIALSVQGMTLRYALGYKNLYPSIHRIIDERCGVTEGICLRWAIATPIITVGRHFFLGILDRAYQSRRRIGHGGRVAERIGDLDHCSLDIVQQLGLRPRGHSPVRRRFGHRRQVALGVVQIRPGVPLRVFGAQDFTETVIRVHPGPSRVCPGEDVADRIIGI